MKGQQLEDLFFIMECWKCLKPYQKIHIILAGIMIPSISLYTRIDLLRYFLALWGVYESKPGTSHVHHQRLASPTHKQKVLPFHPGLEVARKARDQDVKSGEACIFLHELGNLQANKIIHVMFFIKLINISKSVNVQ